MTRRQWAGFAAIAVAAVAFSAVHRMRPNVGSAVPIPEARFEAFASCMRLTDRERRTIRRTPHYAVPDVVRDTLGKAMQGHYAWAIDSIPGVWEHEWMHLILAQGDPDHVHPRWQQARRCGALI